MTNLREILEVKVNNHLIYQQDPIGIQDKNLNTENKVKLFEVQSSLEEVD